jgi:hypothetical protein
VSGANLEYSTDGEEWNAIAGSLILSYDRGTQTSSGTTWGTMLQGSANCSLIHTMAAESYLRARFWIDGRSSSATGLQTVIDGCRISLHKIA